MLVAPGLAEDLDAMTSRKPRRARRDGKIAGEGGYLPAPCPGSNLDQLAGAGAAVALAGAVVAVLALDRGLVLDIAQAARRSRRRWRWRPARPGARCSELAGDVAQELGRLAVGGGAGEPANRRVGDLDPARHGGLLDRGGGGGAGVQFEALDRRGLARGADSGAPADLADAG